MRYIRYTEDDFDDLPSMSRENLESELKDVYIRDLNQSYTIIEDLQQRIDKAIKYIDEYRFDLELPSRQEELLEILGGKQ